MHSERRFRINESGIVHETIDDEVVIINLETGSYYSLQRPGVDIWDMLTSSATVDDIVSSVCDRYDVDRLGATQEVQRLLDELQQENLIMLDPSPNGTHPYAPRAFQTDKTPFVPLQLQKFTDMTHLLLLDPVHDVDVQGGWPMRNPEAERS